MTKKKRNLQNAILLLFIIINNMATKFKMMFLFSSK